MTKKDTPAREQTTAFALSVNGCKITLNFLPDSNGKTIDTVKKILVSSQYQSIPCEAEKAG